MGHSYLFCNKVALEVFLCKIWTKWYYVQLPTNELRDHNVIIEMKVVKKTNITLSYPL